MSDLRASLSWLLKGLMVVLAMYFFVSGEYLIGVFGVVALGISLIPVIVAHSLRTTLPLAADFLITLWMALSVLGESGLYASVPWWDSLLHFLGPAILAYLAFVLIYALHFAGVLRLSIPFTGFFTLMTALAVSMLWEVGEFWVWQLTGRDALGTGGDAAAGLFDTFADLQLDLIGALIVSGLSMWFFGRQRHVRLRVWLHPFVGVFNRRMVDAWTRAKDRAAKLRRARRRK